jgi:GT2 family glycosyltransferase
VPSPSVDVVVLSWNRAELTLEAVDSALAQAGVEVSVLVIDQGSEPEQLARIRTGTGARNRCALVELGRNVGVPAGRNEVIAHGSAGLICNLDNDAIFGSTDVLAIAAAHLDANPQVGLVALRSLNATTGADDDSTWVYPIAMRSTSEGVHRVAKFVGVGHVIRRDLFVEVGGFDSDLFFMAEELDFAFRAINTGTAIDYLGPATVRHRVDPEARVDWNADRFYYFVRNGYYVWEKALPSRLGISARTVGWLVQAARGGQLRQAWRGLRDGRRMLKRLSSADRAAAHLNPAAKAYVKRYQLDLEGSMLDQVREALTPR